MKSGRTIATTNGRSIVVGTKIDSGGQGSVFMGRDGDSDAVYAVKILVVRDRNSWTDLEREIDNAARVKSDCVLAAIDWGYDGELEEGYIVYPYIAGGNLRRKLEVAAAEGKLIGMDACLILLRDIGRALVEIHGAGVIHRDLKPENILLSGDRPHVTDFGISKLARELTGKFTQKFNGDCRYIAPEQWTEVQHTPKIDMYAFGLVAYEVLTLVHPMKEHLEPGASADLWFRVHCEKSPRPIIEVRRDVPRAVERVVMRCLRKAPADRPSASEVLAELTGGPPSDLQGMVALASAARTRAQEIAVAEKAAFQRWEQWYDEWARRMQLVVAELIEEFNASAPKDLRIAREAFGGPTLISDASRQEEYAYDSLVIYRLPSGHHFGAYIFPPRSTAREVALVHPWRLVAYVGSSSYVSCNLCVVRPERDDAPTEIVGKVFGKSWEDCLLGGQPHSDSRYLRGGNRKDWKKGQPHGMVDAPSVEELLREVLGETFRRASQQPDPRG